MVYPPFVMAHVTAPNIDVARTIARTALEARQAACANLIPQVESHYWWKDKLETSAEVLIVFKTVLSSIPALQATVRANHPYEVPEFIVIDIKEGSPEYLTWIRQNVRSA